MSKGKNQGLPVLASCFGIKMRLRMQRRREGNRTPGDCDMSRSWNALVPGIVEQCLEIFGLHICEVTSKLSP